GHGSFTMASARLLTIKGNNNFSTATLTVATGFPNVGGATLDIVSGNQAFASQLTVTTGTLTNAASGTIQSLVGAFGPRTLAAALNNQGTLTVNQPLTLTQASAAHTNSGTIDLTNADLTVTQSGTSPSFTNSGTVTIGTGHVWTITGGTLNQSAGTLGGPGTLSLSSVSANVAT